MLGESVLFEKAFCTAFILIQNDSLSRASLSQYIGTVRKSQMREIVWR